MIDDQQIAVAVKPAGVDDSSRVDRAHLRARFATEIDSAADGHRAPALVDGTSEARLDRAALDGKEQLAAQLRHRPGAGEIARCPIGPAGQIGLRKAGFELALVDQPQVLDRARGRLGDGDEPAHAATAALLASRRVERPRNGAGNDPADLEEAAAGCGGADPEIPRLFGEGRAADQGRKKQTGADETAPPMPKRLRLT